LETIEKKVREEEEERKKQGIQEIFVIV